MYMNHINSCLNPDIVMQDHDEIDTTQVNIENLTHDMSRLHLVESPKIKYTLPWDSNTYANSIAPPPKVNGEYVYCPFWVKHGAPKDYMIRNTYTDIPAWKVCGYIGGVDCMLDYMWSHMPFESKKHLLHCLTFQTLVYILHRQRTCIVTLSAIIIYPDRAKAILLGHS